MGDPLGKAGDWATQTFLRRVLSLGAFWTQMRGLSWVALSLRDGFSFKLAFADALPYAATLLASAWAVPGVEGQTVLQTLRPQEAGGAGPAPRGCGCLQNLLGASGLEGLPGLGEAAVTGG